MLTNARKIGDLYTGDVCGGPGICGSEQSKGPGRVGNIRLCTRLCKGAHSQTRMYPYQKPVCELDNFCQMSCLSSHPVITRLNRAVLISGQSHMCRPLDRTRNAGRSHISAGPEVILCNAQTSQVVKQYYRCLEEGSPYKDSEWARMQAECSSQGPAKPGNRGTPGGPAAYGGSQGGGRGNAGAGRGDCFRWGPSPLI